MKARELIGLFPPATQWEIYVDGAKVCSSQSSDSRKEQYKDKQASAFMPLSLGIIAFDDKQDMTAIAKPVVRVSVLK